MHRSNCLIQKGKDYARLEYASLIFFQIENNDSVNAELTEAGLRVRKETIVLVWISQDMLFEIGKAMIL